MPLLTGTALEQKNEIRRRAADRRHSAEENRRDDAEQEGEKQDVAVGREVRLVEPRFGRNGGGNDAREEPRGAKTNGAAERRQQEALDEHLAHESAATGADREP